MPQKPNEKFYPDTEKNRKAGIVGLERKKYDIKGNPRPARKSRAKDPDRFAKPAEDIVAAVVEPA